jgi:hypothetical protein
VFGPVKMLGGMLVLGRIAASHMSALGAQAQVDPGVAGLNAVFADVHVGLDDLEVVDQVITVPSHGSVS